MVKSIEDLKHVKRGVKGGGQVYVLDTGAVISAEDEAMLQALHSRSIGGFEDHLTSLQNRGSEGFMKNFYVGYGHKSIGDCGTTTLFVEGVSMLVAKAIQDSQLYSGQESSTRYIDFRNQPFKNPLGTPEGDALLESQRSFFVSALEPTISYLRKENPISEGESQSQYDKAINARAFDITRGFLPAGASTNLAWHSNLRQIGDKLLFLRHHPLAEARAVAQAIEEAVLEAHPNSFSKKRYPATEKYQDVIAKHYFHHDPNTPANVEIASNIDMSVLEAHRELLATRPEKTELPKYLSSAGTLEAKFPLDFGSYRDLQRQRSINQRMPLLTTDLGFNRWYIDNLPESVRTRAEDFLGGLEKSLDRLDCSSEDKQCFVPMGYNTSNQISGDLPAMVYVTELRATRFVHPTLRSVARDIGGYIQSELGVPLHIDEIPDRFEIERGKHDITLKGE